MPRITILDASPKNCLLTKKFSLVNGQVVKSDYAKAFEYKYAYADCRGIDDLHDVLQYLGDEPYKCIIHGRIRADADQNAIVYRRKNSIEKAFACFEENPEGNYWAMLDFDKIPVPDDLPKDTDFYLEYLISLLPEYLQDVSYVYQWSSSAGMDDWKTLRCHLWFWLEESRTDTELCHWGKSLNTKDFKLIDDSVFRTVQPNYTANPIFDGGAVDPFKSTTPHLKRIGLIRKHSDTALIPKVFINTQIAQTRTIVASDGASLSYNSKAMPKFDDLLEAIGRPDYHDSIQRAVGSWISSTSPNSNISKMKQRIRDAIVAAPGTGSMGKSFYMSDSYLDGLVACCHFPSNPNRPDRLPETRRERIRFLLSDKRII